MSDRDVCECGDYRASHGNGTGACDVCSWATVYWNPCPRFRLARPALVVLRRAAEITEAETGGMP